MSDPLIGQQLANYRIERLIGRGGMASVYYAWDGKLRRSAAVKVADSRYQDIAYAKRLVREARMMARWHHDHVIQVYYADQQGSLYFFAMEYVDGLDLGALIARYAEAGELIPHADVIQIGRAMAAALDYAHGQGVIHRDVKPSNALLGLDGRIVLSDFGLALDIQQGTLGEVLGTPHYVAPEQVRDSASTVPQSDLYSLAVILYEMLTGSVPFDDPSPMSLALKHVSEPPPLPTQINPSLSIPVEAVLLKALSKAPGDRYPSGEVMIDALERALAAGLMVADERLRTPVADLLAEIAAARATLPIRPEGSDQPSTVPVGLARQRAARQRTIQLLILGGLALAVIAVLALGVALATGLIGGRSAVPATASLSPQTGAALASPPVAAAQATTEAPVPATAIASPTPGLQSGVLPTEPPPTSPLPGPTPTIFYASGYRVVLFYTERGFYLFNSDDKTVQVGPLAFEALDSATGAPAAFRFDSRAWAVHFPTVEKGKCDAIEIRLTSAYALRPPQCQDFNALTTPESSSSEVFWLARAGVAQFRVLWNGQEFARCAAGSGTCEIYLPQ